MKETALPILDAEALPPVPSAHDVTPLNIRHRGPATSLPVFPAHTPARREGGDAPMIWDDAWETDLEPGAALLAPTTGRSVVVFEQPGPPEHLPGQGRTLSESPLKSILTDISARAMTPRQMQELSLDLYVNGILSWDEHVELAFQPDLHPDFARTIGALTGEKPLPDQPRDFVREWERRLDFERRFAPAASRAKERALHILSVLRRIDAPAGFPA